MALWATKLGAFDIKCIPRTTMNSQVIINFLAEFFANTEEAIREMDASSELKLFVDGLSNAKVNGAGIQLKSQQGDLGEHLLQFGFQPFNNEEENEALITRLGLAKKFGATTSKFLTDSQLIVNQVNDTYVAKCPTMAKYLKKSRNF